MQLYPTRTTFHVAFAGTTMVGLGVLFHAPALVAFGGAMVLAVGIGRAFALMSVTRLRGAGFEMVWSHKGRVTRLARGQETVLRAELRNRGQDDVRGLGVRTLHSSMLTVTSEPTEIDLPAGSRAYVDVRVRAGRVGRWGLHGMALEVRGIPVGGDALYEVPLMFANPHGVEVMPQALASIAVSPRGGRARRSSDASARARSRGEGDEFRELRLLVPGDSFRRIAWKASARRGTLLVRETEREDRDRMVCLLDVGCDLWAGRPGVAPLDRTIDEVAAVLAKHLRRNHLTGLAIYASRTLSLLPPNEGNAHLESMIDALVASANPLDADRSEGDEREVALRVSEHLRPLDPLAMSDFAAEDLEALARRADGLKHRAPFRCRAPGGASLRDQRLRHYLGVFGVELGPKVDGERQQAEQELRRLLRQLAEGNTPNLVYVFAPAPSVDIQKELRALRRGGAKVIWALPEHHQLFAEVERAAHERTVSVAEAVQIRAAAMDVRQRATLRKLGVSLRARQVRREDEP